MRWSWIRDACRFPLEGGWKPRLLGEDFRGNANREIGDPGWKPPLLGAGRV